MLVEYAGLARFHIPSHGDDIRVVPLGATPADTVEFLLHHQVMPLVDSQRGRLVVHGSATSVGGRAIAFVGESGAGKSTLAASFSLSGSPFLTDDAIYLQRVPTGYLVEPSLATLRLWSDSRQRLFGRRELPTASRLTYTSKEQLFACGEAPHCDRPLPLPAIYFLTDARGTDIAFDRFSERDAVMALIKHSFLLDIESRSEVASHFAGFSDVAQSVPCFGLTFPRKYNKLPAVRAAIKAHLDSVCDEGIVSQRTSA